ncbi:MAG: peptide deformylase [Bacteroidetes bacterium]|nr:peptide deformylase [Bacteroidota bacterium]
MILPIRAYGDPVLRKKCREISHDFVNLKDLIENMYETMYSSNGVGLAAPQIGHDIRLFVIDTNMFEDKKKNGIKQTFINPVIKNESGAAWNFEEGCLSIPKIRENVSRLPKIEIEYLNEDFSCITKTFEGLEARVIQHEYDHIEGILFIDHLSSFKKQLLKGKLNDITIGKIQVDYKMKFYKSK